MSNAVEFWLGTFPVPGRAAKLAELLEREGWDGLALTDSQNISGDVFVGLALAGQATSRLRLATGASNLATRHPAVVASAISTIQAESGGRAVLGIARGDSALAYIGRKPQPLVEFERGLGQLQSYLSAGKANLDGFESHLDWPSQLGLPKVPVSVAATGPRVIDLAARLADRVTFSVGADPERLSRSIEQARTVRNAAGPDIPALSFGAYVNAVAHPNVQRARELVRGRLSVYARFSTMNRRTLETLGSEDRAALDRLTAAYRMEAHGVSAAQHAGALDDAFIDRFGVAGPSDYVVERLQALIDLGLDHLVIVGHGRDADFETLAESIRRIGREVIPRLRH